MSAAGRADRARITPDTPQAFRSRFARSVRTDLIEQRVSGFLRNCARSVVVAPYSSRTYSSSRLFAGRPSRSRLRRGALWVTARSHRSDSSPAAKLVSVCERPAGIATGGRFAFGGHDSSPLHQLGSQPTVQVFDPVPDRSAVELEGGRTLAIAAPVPERVGTQRQVRRRVPQSSTGAAPPLAPMYLGSLLLPFLECRAIHGTVSGRKIPLIGSPMPSMPQVGNSGEETPPTPEVVSVEAVLAQRVREVRKRRGLTQGELAERVNAVLGTNWYATTVAKIEGTATISIPPTLAPSKKLTPSAETIRRTAQAVSMTELLALAIALNVSPELLLLPRDPSRWSTSGNHRPARRVA